MTAVRKLVSRMGLVLLAGLGVSSALADDDPIRIGVLYPITGAGQIFGQPALAGHELMVKKINESGGLLGRQIESFVRDTKINPAESTAAARDLIAKDKVDFLIGGASSAVGQAISEVAKQEGVVYIAPIPKSVQMTNEENFHKYLFRVSPNTNTEGKSAAVIADRLGFNKICTVLMDYSYGHDLSDAFIAHIKKIRPEAEIVLQVWPKQGTTDYTSYITQMMRSDCDGVFSGIWGSLFASFAKQAKTFGFFDEKQYVSAGEIGSPEVAEAMGDDMPSGVWSNSYETFYYPDTELHTAYVNALKAETGKEFNQSYPSTGYVGMQWLAEGIKKAGSIDADAVIAALEGLTIQTPVGAQTMRASDHQANRGQFWGQMKESNIDGYSAKILDPIEYIPGDGLMD